jgi:hypothetical protein
MDHGEQTLLEASETALAHHLSVAAAAVAAHLLVVAEATATLLLHSHLQMGDQDFLAPSFCAEGPLLVELHELEPLHLGLAKRQQGIQGARDVHPLAAIVLMVVLAHQGRSLQRGEVLRRYQNLGASLKVHYLHPPE